MNTLSELKTNNLAIIVKRTNLRNCKKRWGIIDKRPGVAYVNIYSLLYSLKQLNNVTPSQAIKQVAECVVYLNSNIDGKLLEEAVFFFIRNYICTTWDLKLIRILIPDILINRTQIKIEANESARYICKPMVMSEREMLQSIIKLRSKNSNASEYAIMKAYFHGLIDTQISNWADICEDDFEEVFSKKLVFQYFKSIFHTIYIQRQHNLQKVLLKKKISV